MRTVDVKDFVGSKCISVMLTLMPIRESMRPNKSRSIGPNSKCIRRVGRESEGPSLGLFRGEILQRSCLYREEK